MTFLAATFEAAAQLQGLELAGLPANPSRRRRLVEYSTLCTPALGAVGTALAARRGLGRFGWGRCWPKYLALATAPRSTRPPSTSRPS